jgi:DNA-binding transcriptional LysR family regulator
MLNLHHLELFYYVARHRGITAAAQHIPYGIQQPAISGQMALLEEAIGLKLFERRPFTLTPAGARLYEFVLPFFSRMGQLVEELRGEAESHLRLAASAAVLTGYIPDLLRSLRHEVPKLRLTLRDVSAGESAALLQRGEIDLALTVLDRAALPGIRKIELIRLPLILIAPADFPHKSLAKMIEREAGGRFDCPYPLISLPDHETLAITFQEELARRSISWKTTVEVNAIELVQHYTASGFGVGLFVDVPALPLLPNMKKIPLPGFPPLRLGLFAPADPSPLAARFINAARMRALDLQKMFDAKKKK